MNEHEAVEAFEDEVIRYLDRTPAADANHLESARIAVGSVLDRLNGIGSPDAFGDTDGSRLAVWYEVQAMRMELAARSAE